MSRSTMAFIWSLRSCYRRRRGLALHRIEIEIGTADEKHRSRVRHAVIQETPRNGSNRAIRISW